MLEFRQARAAECELFSGRDIENHLSYLTYMTFYIVKKKK